MVFVYGQKVNKNIFKKYNHLDTLLVITSYPPKGTIYGDGVGGVASFAKNNLVPLSFSRRIVVLAEILDKPEVYAEDKILVCRCWKRNSKRIYADIFRAVLLFGKVKQIEIQFEFSLYGDLLISSFFPLFLCFLKLFGRRVVMVVHQVLLDLEDLNGHLGWSKNSLKELFFSFFLRWYYRFLCLCSWTIVVLEPVFKKRLESLGINRSKIIVIRHGVDNEIAKINQSKARQILGIEKGEFVILCFGFITWYKGSDLIVKVFDRLTGEYPNEKLRLLLAGGASLTQGHKTHYRKYLKKLDRLSKQNGKITITGFIPEQSLRLYFGAADLVVLPYRTFMSSSGVLSLTLSFGKPFILSNILKDWLEGFEGKIKLEDFIFFKATPTDLQRSLKTIILDRLRLQALSQISFELGRLRDYRQLALEYRDLWSDKEQESLAKLFGLRPATVLNDENI